MSKILVINPGSTSTKIALYNDHVQSWQQDIFHDPDELKKYDTIFSQFSMRMEYVKQAVEQHGDKLTDLSIIMSRGGIMPPVKPGAYEVNEEMLDVLEHRPMNHHASNMGAAIAYNIAKPLGIKAYIYDAVTADELIDVARLTGLKEVTRYGQAHNLNMRAAALKYCAQNNVDYKKSSLIIAHLGGGITSSLHYNGRIIDMVSDDEGAFSPERAGQVPSYKLAKIATRDGMDYSSVMKLIQRQGGLMSHLGVTDARKVEEMINGGDEYAMLCYDAMALGVARNIGRLAVLAEGKVDAIVLTGGIAHSKLFTSLIEKRVRFIAPVTIIAGENEMQSLADGACRILSGEEQAREYHEQSDRPF